MVSACQRRKEFVTMSSQEFREIIEGVPALSEAPGTYPVFKLLVVIILHQWNRLYLTCLSTPS